MQDVSYWQALNRALDAEMEADDAVIVLGEDVGLYGGTYRVTEGLQARYGERRVLDTPISEGSFTGLGVGAAMTGLRPVVEIMTVNFALLALDALINMAAKIPFMSGGQFTMPLTVRIPGGVAHQLAAQHSQRLEHTLMNVAGLRIMAPATPQDAYWQLRQAIRSDDCVVVLEHELLNFDKGPLDETAQAPPPHRAAIRRTGSDLTVVSYSRMANQALAAAEQLAEEGIDAEVIDLRSLSPIDWDTCAESLRKTGYLLIAEEDCRFAGAGAEIAASLTERCFPSLRAAPLRVAALDLPNPYNKGLEQQVVPQPEDIAAAARALVNERSTPPRSTAS